MWTSGQPSRQAGGLSSSRADVMLNVCWLDGMETRQVGLYDNGTGRLGLHTCMHRLYAPLVGTAPRPAPPPCAASVHAEDTEPYQGTRRGADCLAWRRIGSRLTDLFARVANVAWRMGTKSAYQWRIQIQGNTHCRTAAAQQTT